MMSCSGGLVMSYDVLNMTIWEPASMQEDEGLCKYYVNTIGHRRSYRPIPNPNPNGHA